MLIKQDFRCNRINKESYKICINASISERQLSAWECKRRNINLLELKMGRLQGNAYFHEHICQLQVSCACVKPVFHSHISPSLVKNFDTEKFY